MRPVIRIDPPRSGLENMEIDWLLLREAEANIEPMTVVRFYGWSEPTVTTGRHQQAERAVDSVYCRLHGIPVVARPTGGRAVLHDTELTYTVVSNDAEVFPIGRILQTYRLIAERLRLALQFLGVRLDLSSGTREAPRSLRAGAPPCFVSPSRYELTWQGRKVAGSAQRHLKRSFLQHGSVPLSIDYGMMAASLGVDESRLKATAVGLNEILPHPASFESLCGVLQRAFEDE